MELDGTRRETRLRAKNYAIIFLMGKINKQLDFLAIGDIVIDAFIRLKDAHVNCSLNKETCELCMRFGDKIPYEFVEVIPAVGNSSNAAVSAARLGLNSGLIAHIGADQNGKDCLAVLKKEKVDAKYVTAHKNFKTNYHYVLWFEDDRTILVKHEAYPYAMPNVEPPKWLYLSSLGAGSEKYHQEIADYLDKNKGVKFAFQPGTFQMKMEAGIFMRLCARADFFVLNTDEARRILKNEEQNPKKLLKQVAALGPKIVIITDGPKGAYMKNGDNFYFMPPYPDPKPPYNRTGAGDAYSATFVSAMALGKTPEEAITWSPINSMSVVQQIGAQRGLLTRAELDNFLTKAPADYKLKVI